MKLIVLFLTTNNQNLSGIENGFDFDAERTRRNLLIVEEDVSFVQARFAWLEGNIEGVVWLVNDLESNILAILVDNGNSNVT